MQKLPGFDVGNLGFCRLCETSFILCLRLNPFLSQLMEIIVFSVNGDNSYGALNSKDMETQGEHTKITVTGIHSQKALTSNYKK